MTLKEPLETLRGNLLRRGLPGDYVSRAVQELADHHADLVEAEHCGAGSRPVGAAETAAPQVGDRAAAAWQRLGDVERLGEELVRKYRARSFSGRHPLVTFVLAPVPVMVLFWVAAFFVSWSAVFGLAELLGNKLETYAGTDWLGATWPLPMWLLLTIHYAIVALPPGICAWWFCRTARRSGRGLRWGTVSCGLVILLACVVYSELQMPHDGKREGMMLIGIGWPALYGNWAAQFTALQRHVLQVGAPLAVLAYAAWRARRLDRAAGSLSLEQRVAA